ncbi:hypothetical protein C1645_779445 [Glomus cerebriforme]|uniref:Uncharacterized protein n=1 Tax=Glomus cerebriforme TaxID=658196 RepID=A0A397SLP8_9GLOM|nr:hypothetical protein C1645_779445 [Glomus cerebriforme]
MPQEADIERTPLLRSTTRNITNNNSDHYNQNNRRSCVSYLGYVFIILTTITLLINLGLYFIELNEEPLQKEASKIPYEYYLRLKSDNWMGFDRFEYVIETSPQNDSIFSKLFIEEDLNSIFVEDKPHNRLKIAEIVVKSFKTWKPAYYEVIENRYEPNNNLTVLTTESYMNGLWFIVWPPKVYISFTSVDNVNNDGERETKFINDDYYERLLKCVYEISWTYKYFGEIYRKCPNESWVKIAYVKGSSEWGMQWLDPERIETYGIVTKPSQSRQLRNVVIRPDSPFPPILPALYVAYFDRIIDRGEADGRTNLLV